MRLLILNLLLLFSLSTFAQTKVRTYTHADSLRGTLTLLRSCYDVTFYDLNIKVDVVRRNIIGYNIIRYKVMSDFAKMQIDLFANLRIDSIMWEGKPLSYSRVANAVFVNYPEKEKAGDTGSIKVYYKGTPQVAIRAPWDGGFSWDKDPNGKVWLGVSCEGTGASCWWPCKDYLGDEPDSMHMTFTVPTNLVCVSNGQLRGSTTNNNNTTTWHWAVTYPINNYDVTLNLADYVHFNDTYVGLSGKPLTLNYYVLKGNEEKARQQFEQVKLMLACFEKYFGPYPFYRDGYKLVETSYWGMEHQSAISYGNNYKTNKNGFDFIIIHESGHEWWGNSVSCSDQADIWIHESFTTYAEALYVECQKGYDSAVAYLVDQRWHIKDELPMVGPYGVNYNPSDYDNDIYYKGSWMLHTFRNVLNNDSLFFSMLKGLQTHFALQTTNTDELIAYINKLVGADYSPFFNQYLHHANPPILLYHVTKKGSNLKVDYKWQVDVPDFNMPVKVTSSSVYQYGKTIRKYIRINPTTNWQTILIPKLKAENFDVDTDEFYVKKQEVEKVN